MTTNQASSYVAEWTVLLYIGAIDNGQQKVDETLLQKVIGSSIRGTSANFVYQFAQPDVTLRGVIRPDGHNEILRRGRRIDITNPEHLTEFVDSMCRTFPSRYTALFLKDHGSGWTLEGIPARRKAQKVKGLGGLGLFYDGQTDRYMSTADVAAALRRTAGKRVDIYGFDACDMGAVEVAYEVRDVADFMIATEDWEASTGWPYGPILKHLRDQSGPVYPREVCREVVKLSSGPFKLVGVELDWVKPLSKALDELGKELRSRVSAVAPWLVGISKDAPIARDLKALVEGLKAQWPGSNIASLAEAVVDALDRARPVSRGGVSIFLPVCSGSNDLASYGAVSFARSNHWTAFVSALNAELLQGRLCGI
jgi:hypothetical protein